MIYEKKEDIIVNTDLFGNDIRISKFTLKSNQCGKHIYIQGGVHGGEITLHIIKKLYDFLKVNLKSGCVDFIPFANPNAWKQKVYAYTVGKFNLQNGKDFNRLYGIEGNLDNEIANAVLRQAIKSDLTIDLHTSNDAAPHTNFMTLDLIDYIKELNLDLNYCCGNLKEYEHSFDTQCIKNGTPSITVECGAHDEINIQNMEMIFQGLVNIFCKLGMVDEKFAGVKRPCQYFEKPTKILAEMGGIVEYLKAPNEKFKKGEPLLKLYFADLTKDPQITFAPFDGIVFKEMKTHIINSCDELMQIVNLKEFKSFK